MIDIRQATADDVNLYFNWRNDEVVAAQSFDSNPIDFELHRLWFEKKLAHPNAFLYVFLHCGVDAGQVRFDCRRSQADISYSLANGYRGRGLATPLMLQAIHRFNRDCPTVNTLVAQVKPDNIASVRVFEKLHFQLCEQRQSVANVYKRPSVINP